MTEQKQHGINAYPLQWPVGRDRTRQFSREVARFNTTFARARDEIVRNVALLTGTQLRWMKGNDVIVSTNIPVRGDGLPYATFRKPDDPGVAVYFDYKGKQMSFACDRWTRIEDNMQAIAKTIEALRGIARWGTGDMMQAAFTGFTALPSPDAQRPWWEVLGLSRAASHEVIEGRYRELRSSTHPDRGGSTNQFRAVQNAWQQYLDSRVTS